MTSCSASDDNDDYEGLTDCEACIQAQIDLCEAYDANKCKYNSKMEPLRQTILDKCPNAGFKLASVEASCWRTNNTDCSYLGFNCK